MVNRVDVCYYPPTPPVEIHAGSVDIKKAPSFGHVALRLIQNGQELCYISFWPKETCDDKACRPPASPEDEKEHALPPQTSVKAPCHWHTQAADEAIYTRRKGLRVKVYELNDDQGIDVLKIHQTFMELKPKLTWGSFGSGPFKCPYELNCAGLSLYLLENGGLENPFKKQVNTFFRASLLLGTMTLLMGVIGYKAYKNRSISSELGTIKTEFAKGYQSSQKLNQSAITALKLNPTPQTEGQIAAINFADMLMTEAFHKICEAATHAEKGVDHARAFLGVASKISMGTGAILTCAAPVGLKLINKTITPANVAHVAREASKREKRVKKQESFVDSKKLIKRTLIISSTIVIGAVVNGILKRRR